MIFEGYSEAKDAWYVLYDSGHQGPFSYDDISALVQLGEIGSNNLLWNSTLPSWQKISEIPNLKNFIPVDVDYKANLSEELAWLKRTSLSWIEPSVEDEIHSEEFLQKEIVAQTIEPTAAPDLKQTAEPASLPIKKYYKNKNVVLGIIVLIFFTSVAFYQFYITKFPFSALPVSAAEKLAMKMAVSQTQDLGATAAIGVAFDGLEKPTFYIATNLPDGTMITVQVHGHRDTLVGKLFYEWSSHLKLKNGIVKTQIILEENGQPLTKGFYDVIASYNNEVLATSNIFLGGVLDESYKKQLASYHQSLRDQAKTELIEVVQFTDTLEMQLNDTQARYDFWGKRRYPIAWGKFHIQWLLLEDQLQTMFKPWTQEYRAEHFYYQSLYAQLVSFETIISEVHQIQHAAVLNRVSDPAIDIKISNARTLLRDIRNRISSTK